MGKRNQKAVPSRGAPTVPVPSTPLQLAVSKIDCYHLLFLHLSSCLCSVSEVIREMTVFELFLCILQMGQNFP